MGATESDAPWEVGLRCFKEGSCCMALIAVIRAEVGLVLFCLFLCKATKLHNVFKTALHLIQDRGY